MAIPAKIDAGWLRPIGSVADPVRCVKCIEFEARWVEGTPDRNDVWCSYCFLYETSWGKNNFDGILWLAESYQAKTSQTIISDGKVMRQYADKILSAIISSSRLVSSMRSRGHL